MKILRSSEMVEAVRTHLSKLRTPLVFRVLRGILAQGYSQAITILLQFISVPVLLRCWGVGGYGEWLVLSAMSTYLTLADLGFAQIAANEMTMEVGAENRVSAVGVFQSVTVLVAVMGSLVFLLTALVVFGVSFTDAFNLTAISESGARIVMLTLSVQTVISLFFGVIGAGLRANGQFALMVFLVATSRLLEQISVLILAISGAGMVPASAAMLLVRIAMTSVAVLALIRSAPWIVFGIRQARISIIKRLFIPSVTYMFYTLGNLVNIQGVTLVVAAVFGPATVAAFSVMRTLARLGPTCSNIVSYALEPEYSTIFGAGRLDGYRLLVTRHAITIGILVVMYVIGVLFFGHWIIHVWTSDRVQPVEPLLTLIMVGCAAEMIWSSGQAPLVAISKHMTTAVTYIVMSASSIVIMDICAKRFGINTIGVVGIVVSMAMIIITQSRIRREVFPSENVIIVSTGSEY